MRTTIPAYKHRRFRFPYLMDIVEDNVRNRCIFPLVALSFYLFIIFAVVNIPIKVYHHHY
jgi:hypothetical protein